MIKQMIEVEIPDILDDESYLDVRVELRRFDESKFIEVGKYIIKPHEGYLHVEKLNPWILIDDDTPKDCDLVLFCGYATIGRYDSDYHAWVDQHDHIIHPTHYQNLPGDPKP